MHLTLQFLIPCLLGGQLTSEPAQPRSSPRIEGTRTVLAAVVQAAKDNVSRPVQTRMAGDELTRLYFRTAAAAAGKLPREQAATAFLLALGVGLDDTNLLRNHPLVDVLWRQIETNEERQDRLQVLGKPTMRNRHDWTLHFVVSGALTEAVGPAQAETIGILKEQLDMLPGGSGFSFGDLSADLAGIALATRLKKGELSLANLARSFATISFLPDPTGLREDLSAKKFAQDYGSLEDARFQKELTDIRRRIEKLYAK